jgi:hypothetical protein
MAKEAVMENHLGYLLVGTVIGTLAMRLIPPQQHDARGLAFLAALAGAAVATGAVGALGAPSLVSWLASFVGSVAAARGVVVRAIGRRNISERDPGPLVASPSAGYPRRRDGASSDVHRAAPRRPSAVS